ncbi:hypothetical protein L3Q82_021339, partial [Scortum barcoo]
VLCVTLLSVLAASAQNLKFGKCPKPAIQATYSPKSPGVIGVLNRELLWSTRYLLCLFMDDGTINSIVGSAKAKNPAEPAKFEVSFFEIASPPGPYWVLSSDYEGHSLVYSCKDFDLFHMEFAWILSREPTLAEDTVEELHNLLSSIGVNVDRMVPTNQDETYCAPMNE